MTDTDDSATLKAEIEKLKEANAQLNSEKGKAELAKAVGEAQRAAILAQLPATETKALEGKVTVDAGATTEIQRLAHRAMGAIVKDMAEAIRTALPHLETVLIHNEGEISKAAQYTTVMRQLNLLSQGYRESGIHDEQIAKTANESVAMALPMMAPFVVGSAVKSVIDLVSLFRTDVDIKGATVTFDDASLVAQVARQLRAAYASKSTVSGNGKEAVAEKSTEGRSQAVSDRSIEVIYSSLYLPGVLPASDSEDSTLLNSLKQISGLRQQADIEEVSFDAKTAAEKHVDPGGTRIAQLKSLNAGYDRLLTGLGQIDDKLNLSALTLLLRGEVLMRKLQDNQSAILFVKAVGGGENRVTRNLWSGGKLFHSGTAILTYLLFTVNDGLVLSDVISKTTNFEEAKLVH
jgi:hypothetical protein